MHHITLDSETDFDGWRKAARTLALSNANPADIVWSVRGHEPELFGAAEAPQACFEARDGSFSVPAKFVELAEIAILHRDGERFALLYRLLWRLHHHHTLLMVVDDPDVAAASAMADAVQRDIKNMEAQLRFRVSRHNK